MEAQINQAFIESINSIETRTKQGISRYDI